MASSLVRSLEIDGLTLNAKKTRILYSDLIDYKYDIDFVEINGEFIKILYGDS